MKIFNKSLIFEYFLAILLLSVLAFSAFIFLRLNPRGSLEEARNVQRMADAGAIADAVAKSREDSGGFYPEVIEYLQEGRSYQVGSGENCNEACRYPDVALEKECLDLSGLIPAGKFSEPVEGRFAAGHSGYYFSKNFDGSFMVGACNEEVGLSLDGAPEVIEVRR